jgi:hypothetical protein
MKNILSLKSILALCMMLLAFSCKKKEDEPVNNAPAQAKYYFNFNMDGVAKKYRSNTLQTGHGFDQKQIGGYVLDGENVGGDAIGLLIWKTAAVDSMSHTEATGLQGQSLFFDDANYMVELHLQIMESGNFEIYSTIDESDHSFKTTITSVVLVGSGTGINGKYNTYEVKGTCSGKIENDDGTKIKTITNGDFYARFTKGIL